MKDHMPLRLYAMNTVALENREFYEKARLNVSAGRREKADRYRNEPDSRRCIAAGLLYIYALCQAGYSIEDARRSRIRTGEHGKPYLETSGLPEESQVYFNLSHSGEYAICSIAFAENGCDVERIRKNAAGNREATGINRIARHFFPAEEQRWIEAGGDEEEQAKRFTRLWTLRESYVKATGKGLSEKQENFLVRPEKRQVLILNQIGGMQEIAQSHYYVKEYEISPGYCCAACSRGDLFEEKIRMIDIEDFIETI